MIFGILLKKFQINCFPGGTSGKESACNAGDIKRLGFDPWVGKIP